MPEFVFSEKRQTKQYQVLEIPLVAVLVHFLDIFAVFNAQRFNHVQVVNAEAGFFEVDVSHFYTQRLFLRIKMLQFFPGNQSRNKVVFFHVCMGNEILHFLRGHQRSITGNDKDCSIAVGFSVWRLCVFIL